MRTYPADTAAARIAKYGFDTRLTRTFEYCDEASAAGDTDLAPVELLIEILIRDDHAQIVNGTLLVDDLGDLPVGSQIIRTRQLMDALKNASERDGLNVRIVDGLERIRIANEWLAAAGD